MLQKIHFWEVHLLFHKFISAHVILEYNEGKQIWLEVQKRRLELETLKFVIKFIKIKVELQELVLHATEICSSYIIFDNIR